MNYFYVFIKSVATFFILLILTRLMGRKQLSQITFFDYIVGITIGSIAGSAIIDRDISKYDTIIALLVWSMLPIIIGSINLKSIRIRKLIESEPVIIIQNGVVNEKNMKKVRYNIGDLLMQLREKGIFELSEVEFALLEAHGELSVLKNSQSREVTLKDLNIKVPYKGMTIEVILDGAILNQNLSIINKDEAWLINELKNRNINDVKHIMYAGYTSEGKLEVVKRQI
ncbi:DUF421 domain-containing protein [Clostridium algidicarnis]|uniref:DUF421 domain-containing protein n=1 Tax=Clostridium algidicarnis TaxID=37659 RepID=UPI001C0DF16F|nr:DUF421 domain-containing protein [Clostridium algidicarnis]MBU3196575.1 DUF421 domain-containing protein [Clostridium algidicarnis]MBU3209928.1 DUF421 domain-containing protein [Clostridium algidicarnis]MBU3228467.1 DUF421 domain-containing protein [Clostridium algidicarnis]MBU3252210.1 DUF421 domain-containing protein [Clostridium algidicarnis]